MPQRPVAPGSGRDDDPGRAEEDWLALAGRELPPDEVRWRVDQLSDGTFCWTTPTRRQYTTEPTRYPV